MSKGSIKVDFKLANNKGVMIFDQEGMYVFSEDEEQDLTLTDLAFSWDDLEQIRNTLKPQSRALPLLQTT
jgi:hypothetical protein